MMPQYNNTNATSLDMKTLKIQTQTQQPNAAKNRAGPKVFSRWYRRIFYAVFRVVKPDVGDKNGKEFFIGRCDLWDDLAAIR